jgi:hypothetical protein
VDFVLTGGGFLLHPGHRSAAIDPATARGSIAAGSNDNRSTGATSAAFTPAGASACPNRHGAIAAARAAALAASARAATHGYRYSLAFADHQAGQA